MFTPLQECGEVVASNAALKCLCLVSAAIDLGYPCLTGLQRLDAEYSEIGH